MSDNLPTIHKQISFPNIFLNSFTQFFTCRHTNKLTEVQITTIHQLSHVLIILSLQLLLWRTYVTYSSWKKYIFVICIFRAVDRLSLIDSQFWSQYGKKKKVKCLDDRKNFDFCFFKKSQFSIFLAKQNILKVNPYNKNVWFVLFFCIILENNKTIKTMWSSVIWSECETLLQLCFVLHWGSSDTLWRTGNIT